MCVSLAQSLVLLNTKVDIATEKGLHWYIRERVIKEATIPYSCLPLLLFFLTSRGIIMMCNTRRLVKISPLFLALSLLSEGFVQAEESTVIDHTATTIQKELISGGLGGGQGFNPLTGQKQPVPRHAEIDDALHIRRRLGLSSGIKRF
jgi:hypothetical protein